MRESKSSFQRAVSGVGSQKPGAHKAEFSPQLVPLNTKRTSKTSPSGPTTFGTAKKSIWLTVEIVGEM
eukprot:scaffold15214_cov72-Cylindrotheca_fusiformis.AAC.1